MAIDQESAEELLEVCKGWIRHLSNANATDNEFKVLYRRMTDAVDAADPLFWSNYKAE